MCLVVGTLFLQSLTVVFRLRLKKQEEVEGAKKHTKTNPQIYLLPHSGSHHNFWNGTGDENQYIR
jgi:hypothetical protein